MTKKHGLELVVKIAGQTRDVNVRLGRTRIRLDDKNAGRFIAKAGRHTLQYSGKARPGKHISLLVRRKRGKSLNVKALAMDDGAFSGDLTFVINADDWDIWSGPHYDSAPTVLIGEKKRKKRK